MARYIDRLERGVKGLVAQRGLNFWHMLLGALTGLAVPFVAGIRPFTLGVDIVPLLLVCCGAFALSYGLVGRAHWNSLLAGSYARLRELARKNLLEHELLLLALADDLPAQHEQLRYVAQSYGKTRARNYSELRKGSMTDRMEWLVENYRVICGVLRLPCTVLELLRRQRLFNWIMLGPTGLLLLAIGLLTALQFAGARALPEEVSVNLLLGSVALMLLGSSAGGALSTQQQKAERGALSSVLVELLDLTDPQPVLEPARPELPALPDSDS